MVEHVYHATRYKLLLTKDSCRITLLLAGITSPRATKDGEMPFSSEASVFSTRKYYQRDVLIVFACDSAGGGGN